MRQDNLAPHWPPEIDEYEASLTEASYNQLLDYNSDAEEFVERVREIVFENSGDSPTARMAKIAKLFDS